jgi:putative endonuclease
MHYFYILRCRDGTFYCGYTKDLAARAKTHNSGKGSVYVRTHGGGKIVYSEKFRSQGDALRREIEVKKWPRQKKSALVKGAAV